MVSVTMCVIVAFAVLVFGIYFQTLAPSIAGGDSGELVAEGCILGTAHPPGYPLMTMIVYLIKLICIDENVAIRVNIVSGIWTSAATGLIGSVVHIVTGCGAGSLFAMGLFAFSPLIWQYAVTAEVFSLNTFFAALILHLVVVFGVQPSLWISHIGAFVCGLAICNQHTIILYELPLILWILVLLRHKLMKSIWLCLSHGTLFLIGLAPYIYVPISASIAPKDGSWGHVTSIDGFLNHFLRKDYGTFQLFSGANGQESEGLIERTTAYAKDLYHVQGLFMVPLLAILGILAWCTFYRTVPVPARAAVSQHTHNNSATPKKMQTTSKGVARRLDFDSCTSPVVVASSPSCCGPSDEPVPVCDLGEAAYTPVVILLTQLFYLGVFHSLANLPLTNRLLYGVHQRFWMQPNVMTFAWAGIGFAVVIDVLCVAWSMLTKSQPTKSRIRPPLPAVTTKAHKKAGDQRAVSQKKTQQANTNHNNNNSNNNNNNSDSDSGAAETKCDNLLIRSLGMVFAVGAVITQYRNNIAMSDQSLNYHFKNYAASLLKPLPPNATLLINYDMQWTSVRYLQKCEGMRSDVTAINLSMMTYKWFQHKRRLYPNLQFPGLYHCSPANAAALQEGGFTLMQFLELNIDAHEIFISGKLSYPDPLMSSHYDLVPFGLVSHIVPTNLSPSGDKFHTLNSANWKVVMENLPSLPSEVQFPEETWEWTIGRDFKDRVADTAAYQLDAAIPLSTTNASSLIAAVYWLESALLLEGKDAPISLLKNAGLAHVHLIQCKLLSDAPLPIPNNDYLNTLKLMNWPSSSSSSWQTWSSDKFVLYWGEFVARPDAHRDPQFQTIKNMYEIAIGKLK